MCMLRVVKVTGVETVRDRKVHAVDDDWLVKDREQVARQLSALAGGKALKSGPCLNTSR